MWIGEKTAFSESRLVWGVVTLTFNFFPVCFWTHPHLIMKGLVRWGQYNFSPKVHSFGFRTLSDCTLIVLKYGFGVAQSYASNVQLRSEFQKNLFRCEFAKPWLFRISLVSGIVRLTFKWCLSLFLAPPRLFHFPPIFQYGGKLIGCFIYVFAIWQYPSWTLNDRFWSRIF